MGKAKAIYSAEDLTAALKTMASLNGKMKKVQAHFDKGTSQHTLAKNRLKAFRISIALIKQCLSKI